MTLSGTILITGGAGTLGRAIVRTALAEQWDARFTIYSRSEFLQAQMRALYPHCRYLLGDVADYDRLEAAIAGHDLVIHAAAAKRIPEAEQQPWQCYMTNIIGSQNVARACMANRVHRCIGISTDKACKAITAYGASKLAMEKIFQAQRAEPTIFTLVRYGNVVASRGSVIPLWRQQAAEGRALTLTDPDATRFWMSETDAVRLIEHGGRIGHGETIVPRMGALSLAEMAAILAPGSPTQAIGWRSIEKKHEDLIHEEEPVQVLVNHFTISAAWGLLGRRYTSEIAPRLTPDQFMAMLEEAEVHAYA